MLSAASHMIINLTHSGSGLWWESDPVLAKRFRKDAGS